MLDTYERALLFLIYGTILLFLLIPMIYRKRFYASKKVDDIDIIFILAIITAVMEMVRIYTTDMSVFFASFTVFSLAFIALNCAYGKVALKAMGCWKNAKVWQIVFYGIYFLFTLYIESNVFIHHLVYIEGNSIVFQDAFFVVRFVFLLMMFPYGVIAFVKLITSKKDKALHEEAKLMLFSYVVLLIFDLIQIPYLDYEYSTMLPYTMSISFLALTRMAQARVSAVEKIVATQTELETAKKIQQSLIPQIFPKATDSDRFELYAKVKAAKELGGDFYDYRMLDEDHLMMVIADVSGYGIPAALFMAVAKTLIKNTSSTGYDVQEIIEKVNDGLCDENTQRMFVTIWIGILDISSGELTCVNAGHEAPILARAGKDFEICDYPHGLVAGALPGRKYEPYCIKLEPGDRLFLYTDGIPEAKNEADAIFGMESLLDSLNRSGAVGAQGLFESVISSIKAFRGKAPQYDDMTMMYLEYRGDNEGVSA